MPTFETGSRLFVGSLLYTVTAEEFAEFFNRFGKTRDIYLKADRDPSREAGRNAGFGFVTMDTPELAEKVIKACHNRPGPGGRKIVVRLANIEDKR